jgi:hypothetical protein
VGERGRTGAVGGPSGGERGEERRAEEKRGVCGTRVRVKRDTRQKSLPPAPHRKAVSQQDGASLENYGDTYGDTYMRVRQWHDM